MDVASLQAQRPVCFTDSFQERKSFVLRPFQHRRLSCFVQASESLFSFSNLFIFKYFFWVSVVCTLILLLIETAGVILVRSLGVRGSFDLIRFVGID